MDKVIVIRHSDDKPKHFNNKILTYALSQIKNSNGTNH